MFKLQSYTQDDYTHIGITVGSDPIHREGEDGLASWKRDREVLKKYAFTDEDCALFEELLKKHGELINKRSETVARKKGSLAERDQLLHMAWIWVEQAGAMLGRLAVNDADLARRFNETYPEEDNQLWRAIEPINALLVEYKSAFGASVPVQALIDEAPALRERLNGLFGRIETAKAEPIQDTREIDELDGRIYVLLRDLNSAGRRAIRAGLLTRQAPYYRFNHLRRAPRPTPTPDTPA